jgi:O-antigen/teichoic acid export membrane protein
MANSGVKRFSRDVALTLGARLFIAGGSLLGGVIVARWLGAESVGVLASLNVIALLMITLGSLGMPSATTYMVATRKNRSHQALTNAIYFSACIGSILAVLISAVYLLRPGLFGDVPGTLIYVTAGAVPFQLLSLLCLSVLIGLGRLGIYNLLDMAAPAALFLNPVIVAFLLKGTLSLLVVMNAAAVIVLSVCSVIIVRRVSDPGSNGGDPQLLKETLRYGSRFYLAMIAAVVLLRADLLLVNYFRGTAEAGVYAVASQVGTLLMMVPTVISTVLFPRAASAGADSVEMTSRVTRHAAFIMFLACLAAVPGAFLLPFIFGPKFEAATLQVLILLPGILLFSVESVQVQYFGSIGLPRMIPAFWIVTMVVNITLDLIFIPLYGATAAAVVSSISYGTIFALVATYFMVRTRTPFFRALLITGAEIRELISLRAFSAATAK